MFDDNIQYSITITNNSPYTYREPMTATVVTPYQAATLTITGTAKKEQIQSNIAQYNSIQDNAIGFSSVQQGGSTGGGSTGITVIDYDPTLPVNQGTSITQEINLVPSRSVEIGSLFGGASVNPTLVSGTTTIGVVSATISSNNYSICSIQCKDGQSFEMTFDKDILQATQFIFNHTVISGGSLFATVQSYQNNSSMYLTFAGKDIVPTDNSTDVTFRFERVGNIFNAYVNNVLLDSSNPTNPTDEIYIKQSLMTGNPDNIVGFGFDLTNAPLIPQVVPSTSNDGDYLKALSYCNLLGKSLATGDFLRLYNNKTQGIKVAQ